MTNSKSSIKLASIITYITLILGNTISIVYTPFMLSQLGKSQYGTFSLVNTIISYIHLLDLGLSSATIRYNSKYMAEGKDEELKRLNGMILLLYCLISLVGILVGGIIILFSDNIFSGGLATSEISRLKIMIVIAIINLAFAFPFTVFNGIILANERFVFVKSLNLLRTVLNPIIMVSILVFGYKAIGMLIGSTIFNFLLGSINIFYCRKKLNIKFIFNKFDKKIFKEIFNYSFFIFLGSIAYQIFWSTDQIILGMFVSSAAIAVYTVGAQFNNYYTAFSNVISNMFLPKLSKMVANNNMNEIMKLLIKVSRIQYFIATYILGGFFLVGQSFIKRWAGDGYEKSFIIALLIMIPQIISIIQNLFSTLLEAMNKHRVKSFIFLCVAVVNLIITVILVQKYEAIGCAIGTCIGMIINGVSNNLYYIYKLNFNMGYYWKEIFKLIPATLLSVGISYFIIDKINPQSYFTIALSAIIFSIIYLVINWITTFNNEEKGLLKLHKRNITEDKTQLV